MGVEMYSGYCQAAAEEIGLGNRDAILWLALLKMRRARVTPWSESPSKISASEAHKRSVSDITPRQEFKDL
ncbi:hypothetical protein TNCV_2369051 [Trichonephila clavipes]|nr:hypothetical protein TNCV_2369051 [Trichonephila clavipes]